MSKSLEAQINLKTNNKVIYLEAEQTGDGAPSVATACGKSQGSHQGHLARQFD